MSEQDHQYNFKTLMKVSSGVYREKGSKFLAYAHPVSDLSDIESTLALIRRDHPKARHLCFAYRLGVDRKLYRANDDGEPSGTGGKPILGRIDAAGLTNVLIGVIRYFGGTKLGAAGLGHAYRNAAADALQAAEVVTKVCMKTFEIRMPYGSVNSFQQIVHELGAAIHRESFDEQLATFNIELPISKVELMQSRLNNVEGMQIDPTG